MKYNRFFTKHLFHALQTILGEKNHAARVISTTLKQNPQWNEQQKALFVETLYDLIRWWRLLWYVLDKEPSWKEEDLQQLLSTYALLSEQRSSPKKTSSENLTRSFRQRYLKARTCRPVRESIPDWLDSIGTRELGPRWEQELTVLNTPSPLTIRVNTLQITKQELKALLGKKDIQTKEILWAPDALLVQRKQNLFVLKEFQQGFFEVQDPASQMVSCFLDPKPGMVVVDACAGEGGKTLHLAALMKNKGQLIAMDTETWKLRELRRRANRAGVSNVHIRTITSSKVYKRLKGHADRVLLDVPCSGLGVLRRKPEIRWHLEPDTLPRLYDLQRTILERYAPLCKPLGRLAYATCSILPSEGEYQIHQFLARHHEYRLLEEKRYWPVTDGSDGFYMALLEKTSTDH